MRQAILGALCAVSFLCPPQAPERPDLLGHTITSEGVVEQWIAQDPVRVARVASRAGPLTDPDITLEWTSGKKKVTLNFWKKIAETEEQFLQRVEKRTTLMQRIYPE